MGTQNILLVRNAKTIEFKAELYFKMLVISFQIKHESK